MFLNGQPPHRQTVPEDIMMAVNLLPSAATLQYPAVADHGTARALRAVAALRPVVQHQPAGGGVEDGQSLGQGWEHTHEEPVKQGCACAVGIWHKF